MKEFKKIEKYYTEKFSQHGASPKGVDWNSMDSQYIRFEKLSNILTQEKKYITINDIGCGYGEYSNFLKKFNFPFHCKGYDISKEMINEANTNFKNENNTFTHIENFKEIIPANFSIASGIFNLKFDYNESDWKKYVDTSLFEINKVSKDGFSFNILSSYSDKHLMKNNLYYADPLYYFDFCKNNFSKNVSLLHDYDLYEFTILVRKK